MALIERLMAVEEPRIPVHEFFAAVHLRIDGQLTRQNVLDMFLMSAADIVDYDAVAALAPTGATAGAVAAKAMFINKIHSVLILARSGNYAGYTTPAEVRVKLGI